MPLSLPAFVVLLVTTTTIGNIPQNALPVLAPEVARDYGISATFVGYQLGVLGAGTMLSLLLLGNARRRIGGARVLQAGLVLQMAGLLALLLPGLAPLAFGSALVGVGLGLATPAVAHLLMRFVPPGRISFFYSLQQTGVPLGSVCAAAFAPVIAIHLGWRAALIVIAVLLVAATLALQPHRRRWDDDRDRRLALTANPLPTLRQVLVDRRLAWMSLAGACYTGTQISVTAFTVVLLVEVMGYGLVLAGLVLMSAQLCGVLARVICGWLSDRQGGAPRVLAALSILSVIAYLLALALSPRWPPVLVFALFALLGGVSAAWPGAFLAEVIRLSTAGQASAITGTVLALTTSGKILLPLLFGTLAATTGSYLQPFALLALVAVVSALAMRMARRPAD
jgi:predicted MFS family arabinose efflux permease